MSTLQSVKENAPEYLLEMRNVDKRFPGVHALQNITLKIRPGTVHALMGENGAGKSTLMKCLFGIYKMDSGEIVYQGRKVQFKNPRDALDQGVSMVHQELNQVPELSVMENIWLGRMPKKHGMVDDDRMYKDTQEIFKSIDLDIDPRTKINTLSVSQRQMIEIAKAVSCNAKIIILDEPTSSLTETEVEHLFRIINKLRDGGSSIIYISHKMEEILRISDDVTVMRDGQWIYTGPSSELDTDTLINLIVGRELTQRFPEKTNKPTEEVMLEVEHLKGEYQPTVKDASFTLRKGEILGIAGLMGSRRTEVVETIFGIRKRSGGTIKKENKLIENKSAKEAINNGFALVTEDRRQSGIFYELDLSFNSTIANLSSYSKFGIINKKAIKKDADWVMKNLRVKAPSLKEKIGNLSGGNQQKVILGRWLLTNSKIMMLDEPTRGIDVGAKYEIYQLINDYASRGNSVIFISSEMPELLGVADRILVMSNGKVAGILDARTATQQDILRLAAKYL